MVAEPWIEVIAELQRENAELRQALKEALARIDELERAAARQAAPFRQDEEQKIPPEKRKKPGRKKGHRGARRPRPPHVDCSVVVDLPDCPLCGGPVGDRRPITQYIEELPPVRPIVTRLTTWKGKCSCCGEVHSSHPLQTSFAIGAAGVMLGPRAVAELVWLRTLGLSLQKICAVAGELFQLKLTKGGLQHLLARVAKRLEPHYQDLQAQVRASAVVYADETSWYVGEPGHWLWVFTTPQYTLYHVAPSRGGPVAEKILGQDFAGVLVTDCYPGYLRFKGPQHKCVGHHQQANKKARRKPKTKNLAFLDAWKQLWKDVVALHKARDGLAEDAFVATRSELETRFDTLLAQEVTQPGDQVFQVRMRNVRKHRFTCLYHRDVDPTNNRAEQALRPAVISRKISCGNKTSRGAHTWEILVSLAVTAHQQGRSIVHELATQVLPVPCW